MSIPDYLVFMRHGIAMEREDWHEDDLRRPLTKEGRDRTACIAASFLDYLKPDAILTSDAVRAFDTAEIFAAEMRKPPQIESTTHLRPDASVAEWKIEFKKFCRVHRDTECLLIIGHEPTLSEIVADHLGDPKLRIQMKKAGIAVVRNNAGGRPCLIALLPPALLIGKRS